MKTFVKKTHFFFLGGEQRGLSLRDQQKKRESLKDAHASCIHIKKRTLQNKKDPLQKSGMGMGPYGNVSFCFVFFIVCIRKLSAAIR